MMSARFRRDNSFGFTFQNHVIYNRNEQHLEHMWNCDISWKVIYHQLLPKHLNVLICDLHSIIA